MRDFPKLLKFGIWGAGVEVQFSVCACSMWFPRIRKSEKFCTRKKPVAAGALSRHANESVNWSSAVRPREQWIVFLAKNRQMATQFSENRIFCRKFPVFEKKIRQKNDRKLVWGGGMVSSDLCLLDTVFRDSWNKFAS